MRPNIIFDDDASKYRGYPITTELLTPVGFEKKEYAVLDRITNTIWSALKERNWKVPGITVEFTLYGRGENMYRKVRSIEGDDFYLKFGRSVGSLAGDYNNASACDTIVVPKFFLNYYDDLSGSLTYYVGKDWSADRERFKHDVKIHSKLDGKEKWYLKYHYSDKHPLQSGYDYTMRGSLPTYFVADNDIGREYDPQGLDPVYFVIQELHMRTVGWLVANVMPMIEAVPIAEQYVDPFSTQETQQPIPMPQMELPVFFTGVRREIVDRKIKDPSSEIPFRMHGLRQFPYGNKNDGTVPDVARNGFIWAGTAKDETVEAMNDIEVGEWYDPFDRRFGTNRYNETPAILKPKVANNVFIFDAALANIRREEIVATLGERDRLTDDEVSDFLRASARTLVPITEYKGGFIQPVMLINRELTVDEIELVSIRKKQAV